MKPDKLKGKMKVGQALWLLKQHVGPVYVRGAVVEGANPVDIKTVKGSVQAILETTNQQAEVNVLENDDLFIMEVYA